VCICVCVWGGLDATKYCPDRLLLILSHGMVLDASLLLDPKQINVVGAWKNARNWIGIGFRNESFNRCSIQLL